MSDPRWELIKDILHRALQMSAERRGGFLDDACSGDAAIRAEVESLLAADADARPGFLRSTPRANELSAAWGALDGVGTLAPGQIFEQRFRLVRKLGEGGMGQVWLAEQTAPVQRQVALKLIAAGMYDEAVMQRFLGERQSLAMMDHPCIAKVFDAGATPQGQPYFVMEYVPGSPITEYCDQKRLTIAERLELFILVCEGVQHAHQKAVIHRDLKPANILVVEVDGKAVPRIIDFGLAKATAPKIGGEDHFTRVGQFVGTPGYMSPEQANLSVQDLDTRTDVYSLGVVLYVLLTGAPPFDPKPVADQPVDEWLRRLREDEVPSPSAKVSADRATSSAAAPARGIDRRQLIGLLRGDLDWITLKTLEKDRARRYGGPSELAAELRRYLNHEPVLARPASTGYRFRKYARRHRIAVGVAAGLTLLLTAFSVLQALELRRTTRERDRANLERDRANQERDRATRITDFMTGMFKVSDPSEARGNTVTAREILDKAAAAMDTGLAKDSEVQAQMRYVIASTYLNLGLYARADALAKSAYEARSKRLGPNDPKTLESMTQLGWILDREGHAEAGATLERQALAGAAHALGSDAALTLEAMDHLAVILEDQGHYEAAEKLARQAVEVASQKLGPESAQTLLFTNHLTLALWGQARYAEAERLYRQLLAIDQRVLGPDHPQSLEAMLSLAAAIAQQGRSAEAERLYREVMAAQERVLGPEHQYTLITLDNLAVAVAGQGRLAEGEKLNRKALEIKSRTLGPDHPETLLSKLNLSEVLLKENHVREAERLQRQVLATQVRVLGAENPDTLVSQTNLATILIHERRYTEAEKLAAATIAVQLRTLGPRHPETLETARELGRAMAYRHRYAEARKLLQDLIAKQGDSPGQGNRWSAWYAFACVAVAAGYSDDALRYLRKAVELGFSGADDLLADDELKPLRHEPQFQALIAALKVPAARVTTVRQ